MPQQYLKCFHLGNDLRTTFAILKSSPSTCEMAFIYCILQELYSWIQYLDLKGKNEIEKNGISGYSALKKQYMAGESAEAVNLFDEHAG